MMDDDDDCDCVVVSDVKDCPKGYWAAAPGQRCPWLLDGYQGPQGTVAVAMFPEIPEEMIIFIKDHMVIDTIDPDERGIKKGPEKGTYDAILVNPNSAPSREMAITIH
jgi:hypothetical protein